MNIVLLFEGTWNCGKKPSVISRLSDALIISPSQRTHLVSGSGARGWWGKRLYDGVTGGDSFEIVGRQYRWLTILATHLNLQPKDINLYLFGFSRGAFQAKIFADMFTRFGLQSSISACNKSLSTYKEAHLASSLKSNLPSQAPSFVNMIKYMGLIDAVDSLLPKDKWKRFAPLPSQIIGRHALSLDELRADFSPIIHGMGNLTHMWFAGVHSDIGWGYSTSTLALIPIRWLLDDSRCANLQIKVSIDRFPRCFMDMAVLLTYYKFLQHNSRRGLWKLRKKHVRTIAVGNKHQTVIAVEQAMKALGIVPSTAINHFLIPKQIAKFFNVRKSRKTLSILYRNITTANNIFLKNCGYSTVCQSPICLHPVFRRKNKNHINCPYSSWP